MDQWLDPHEGNHKFKFFIALNGNIDYFLCNYGKIFKKKIYSIIRYRNFSHKNTLWLTNTVDLSINWTLEARNTLALTPPLPPKKSVSQHSISCHSVTQTHRVMMMMMIMMIMYTSLSLPWEASWFQAFAVFWTLYSFFWANPERPNCMCRSFGTLCSIFIGLVHTTYEDGTECSETSTQNSDAGNRPKERTQYEKLPGYFFGPLQTIQYLQSK